MRDDHGRSAQLKTPSLESVFVHESVVRELKRRQHASIKEHGAYPAQGDRGKRHAKPGFGSKMAADVRACGDQATLARLCRRIQKMVPYDERGACLLDNLLAQTKTEEREALCLSIENTLNKRTEALAQMKACLKREFDRRCVFTKATNEIRTATSMMAESNRFDILSTIVRDLHHAHRIRENERKQHRVAASKGGKSGTPDASGTSFVAQAQSQPRESAPNVEKMPPEPTGTAAPGRASRRGKSAAAAVTVSTATQADGKKCQRKAKQLPVPRQNHSHIVGQVESAPSLAAAAGAVGAWRMALPPLEQRYGVGVTDAWAHSPVALRLGRQRRESVSIASMDQAAFLEYMDKVLQDTEAKRLQTLARGASQGPGGVTKDGGATTREIIDSCIQRDDLSISTGETATPALGKLPGGSTAVIPMDQRRGSLANSKSWQSLDAAPNQLDQPRELLAKRQSWQTPDPATTSILQSSGYDVRSGGHGLACAPGHDQRVEDMAPIATLDATALAFRSRAARKVFKQTRRLLEALHTPARTSLVGSGRPQCGDTGKTIVVQTATVFNRNESIGSSAGSRSNLGRSQGFEFPWRGTHKSGDGLVRLADVFRCVCPPRMVRIESEIVQQDALARSGRVGEAGGGARGGMWDDFICAWEYLGDGILAGRALTAYWRQAEERSHTYGAIAARSERANDDLLADGLMRALLFTRCYRPPGLDQLFVQWLGDLLETVRVHVRVGCTKLPLLHGLTAGLDWFHEVCSDESFGQPLL